MSKHSQEEAQSIAYYDEFQNQDWADYDDMITFFEKVREAGYENEAMLMEDEWRSNHRAEIEKIETFESALRDARI